MHKSWLAWITGVFLAIMACSANEDTGVTAEPILPGTGQIAGGGLIAGGGGADAGATPLTGVPAPIPDAGGQVTTVNPGFTADMCASTKTVAPPASLPKIDIVWIVDSSQSMFDEQKRISDNLAAFANAITTANLDVSIAMVSQTPSLTGEVNIPLPGLCPILEPDPLAGNPFSMDPRYHFVQQYVNSQEPLAIALSAYPRYAPFLRAGSVVHFIIVTDDDATGSPGGTPEGRATQFQTAMMQRLGRPFRVHTISSPGPTPCTSTQCQLDAAQGLVCVFLAANCTAARSGLSYYALASMTSGLTASICEADWTPIFKAFQENIIKSAPLPCDYTIPPPPKGESLEPGKVNVAYTPPGAAEEQLGKVAGQAACAGKVGWYYDNEAAPTKVLLCPDACSKVAAGGTMNVVYGCKTVVLN